MVCDTHHAKDIYALLTLTVQKAFNQYKLVSSFRRHNGASRIVPHSITPSQMVYATSVYAQATYECPFQGVQVYRILISNCARVDYVIKQRVD